VEVIIRGSSNQAIIGTDKRAFVFKKGFMASASFGTELTERRCSHLVGVQIHTGIMSGSVILQGPGQSGTSTSTSTSTYGRDAGDPYKSPNAIPIIRQYEPAQAGVARLRELIHNAQNVAPNPTTTGPEADELTRLAALRDSADQSRWSQPSTSSASEQGLGAVEASQSLPETAAPGDSRTGSQLVGSEGMDGSRRWHPINARLVESAIPEPQIPSLSARDFRQGCPKHVLATGWVPASVAGRCRRLVRGQSVRGQGLVVSAR
jgi:hypothetical protein